jgi:hypothetical protein
MFGGETTTSTYSFSQKTDSGGPGALSNMNITSDLILSLPCILSLLQRIGRIPETRWLFFSLNFVDFHLVQNTRLYHVS